MSGQVWSKRVGIRDEDPRIRPGSLTPTDSRLARSAAVGERSKQVADFEVGDRVLHPRYGPGTLTSVKKMKDDGEVKQYYVIQLTRRKGRLLTPVEKADKVGLHSPRSREDRDDLWEVIAREPKEMPSDFRKRRKEIRTTFRSGSLTDMGRVVRDLAWRQAEGEATTGDRRLLKRAKDLVAEELAAMGTMKKSEAEERVEEVLETRFEA